MEVVPICIWHQSFFNCIVSSWGTLIKIDEETARRERFDRAKILTLVNKKADIPSTIKIAVEGKKYLIRIQTEDYQEEEAWIDGTKINSRKTESNTDGDGYGFEVSGDSWKILWDSEEEASFEVGTEQNNKGNERKSVEEANVLEKELSTHQSPLQAESSFGKMDQEVFGPEEHRKNLNMELQEVNLALERKQNTPDGPDSPSINNAYKNLPENRLLDIPISNMPLQSSIRLFWGIGLYMGSESI
ncbi:hypothetical protein V6N13_052102 [Hibiscus sabdariffa]